jgi:hypothetical protein
MDTTWIWWIVGGLVTGIFTMVARASYPYLAREASYRIGRILLKKDQQRHPAYWASVTSGMESPYKWPHSWLYLVWKWLNGLP